jgi:putative endonuclease
MKTIDKENYWIYILHCDNGSLYTGYTNDLMKRYQAHLDGSANCKYTRSFKPLSIAQCWRVNGHKSIAMKIERYIKKMPKAKKIQLITEPQLLVSVFSGDEIDIKLEAVSKIR